MNRPENFSFDIPDLPEKYQKMVFDDPNLMDAWQKYAEVNKTGADFLTNPDAYNEWVDIFFDGEKLRTPRGIQARMRAQALRWLARAEQLKTSDAWKKQGLMSLGEQKFAESPRDEIKALQEPLSANVDRIVARAPKSTEGVVTAGIDVNSFVIDPEQINDTLLENLGLNHLKTRKKAGQEERMATRAKAIPEIKEILANLQPLALARNQRNQGSSQYRMYRVGKGEREGFILGMQEGSGEQEVIFGTDLHSAYRRIDNIQGGYGHEMDVLESIRAELRAVRLKIAGPWKDRNKDDSLAEINEVFEKKVAQLKHVRDEDKVKLRKLIQDSIGLEMERTIKPKDPAKPEKTVKGFNPGARAAQMENVDKYIGDRMRTMRGVMGTLAPDTLVLRGFIKRQEGPVTKFFETVIEKYEKFAVFKPEQLSNGRLSVFLESIKKLRVELAKKTDGDNTNLPLFEPYLAFARTMLVHLEDTITGLEAMMNGLEQTPEERQITASDFLRVYLVAKMQEFYKRLIDWYSVHLSGDGEIDLDAALIDLEAINKWIYSKPVTPSGLQVNTPDYDPKYGELYHIINSLKKRLIASKTCSEKERSKLKEEMKNRVKGFDFAKLLLEEPAQKNDESKTE